MCPRDHHDHHGGGDGQNDYVNDHVLCDNVHDGGVRDFGLLWELIVNSSHLFQPIQKVNKRLIEFLDT